MGSTLFTKQDLPLWMQMQQNAPAQAQEQHYQDYFQRQKDISGAVEKPDMFSDPETLVGIFKALTIGLGTMGVKQGIKILGKKPSTIFQKQYGKLIEHEGKGVWQFPGRYTSSLKEGISVEIPKTIRIGKGLKPTEEQLNAIKGAYKASKSELGYTHVQDIVDLSGLPKEDVYQNLTYLVKNGRGALNVDRWGHAAFFKYTGD